MKKYLFCFISLATLCIISLLLTYGYEEGTMRNKIVGEFFSFIFKCFKFPLSNMMPDKFLILSLLLNVLIYTIILPAILVKIKSVVQK